MFKKEGIFQRGQIGIEYLIIMGFVTFAITLILTISIVYSNQISDRIKMNQIESFVIQLIHSAESVFFAGQPSKTTVNLYIPEGVESINFKCEDGGDPFCGVDESYYLYVVVQTSAGEDVKAYESKVPINGTLSISSGTQKISLEAVEVGGVDYIKVN